ncbi:MAG: polysaccharide pyruvyl transferase family protein [Alphaproteobacteria bacterium]|nr:polysaccharide pyruvyl transferase family protein [Alphaproteobacteria bacterium]MBP7759817.1 polysaccharide pyruvyl transferase family protein [Alphaproteobacteria bacterium]MBP7763061.1 polysaccharide pyruvyl transferase family protein [Alphaproteobacteria bacterium]MBP7905229.1 polysaccharide pyruvyl transferase family protein [Alphaproteobacteria bacterium]
MKVFMYDAVPNFGDMLNKYLWRRYFGELLDRKDKILMFGIGTVLGEDTGDAEQVIVCGSGCGYSRKIERIDTKTFNIFFVRGQLTAKLLGLPESTAITDPGILTPECFPPGSKHGRVVFVPHWESASSPLWRIACERAGIEYVDPLGDITAIMRTISGASLVIAEAMHAAIVADSYRVPWVAVTTSARINLFKWNDWAGSLDMVPDFHHFSALGPSDTFRTLTSSKDKEIRLEEVGQKSETVQAQAQDSRGGGAKRMLKKIYKIVVPAFIRNRKDDFLNHKLGPFLDKVLAGWIRAGLPSFAMNRAVRDLEMLKDGAKARLSDEVVSKQRIAQMHRRLEDVRLFLDKKAA